MKKYEIKDFEVLYIQDTLSIDINKKTIGYMFKGDTWHWITPLEAKNIMSFFEIHTRNDGTHYHNIDKRTMRRFAEKYAKDNLSLYSKICKQMQEGDGFERFLLLCDNTTLRSFSEDDINRIITKIGNPLIERATDNQNKDTFDYITVECSLVKFYKGSIRKFINSHIREINDMVLKKIEHNRTFQRYGVPVNVLKAADIKIYGDFLVYKFELKSTKENTAEE